MSRTVPAAKGFAMHKMVARSLWLLVGAAALGACNHGKPPVPGAAVDASNEAVLQCSVDVACMTNRICENGQCRFAEKGLFLVKGQVGSTLSAMSLGRTAARNYFLDRGSCPRSNAEVFGCKSPDGEVLVGADCTLPYRQVSIEEAALNEYTSSVKVGATQDGDCLVEGVTSDKSDRRIRGKKILSIGRRNAKGQLDWQEYSNIDAKYLPPGTKHGLPAATFADPTYPTSFDCTAPNSIPKKLICQDRDLAASDIELAAVLQQAKAAALDPGALADLVAGQMAEREKSCRDKPCLTLWFARQMTSLNQIAQTGYVPGADPASQRHQGDPERQGDRGAGVRRGREESQRPARAREEAQQWTPDQAYEARRGECTRGFLGTFCRKKLKAQLCEGHWSSNPQQGFSICKQDE
jgi:hypothetical protein